MNIDTDMPTMFRAYVECALWSSTDSADDSGGAPLDDNYGPEDLDSSAEVSMLQDCEDFALAHAVDLATLDASQVGHDLWLTRNHHGAGFWDRGLGELGERLTAAAHAYGESDVYVGDDGSLYVS